MNSKELFEKVNVLRIAKGWSLYELTKRADLSESTLYSWKDRGTMPSLYILENTCNALNISLSYLFSGEEGGLSEEAKTLLNKWELMNKEKRYVVNLLIDELLKG